jgi:hypothetical protein
MIHAGGAGYEIEFVTLAGETVSVVTVPAEAVRPVRAQGNRARTDGRMKRRLRRPSYFGIPHPPARYPRYAQQLPSRPSLLARVSAPNLRRAIMISEIPGGKPGVVIRKHLVDGAPRVDGAVGARDLPHSIEDAADV